MATTLLDKPKTETAEAGASFILGMGKVGEEVKMLLDIDKVLIANELEELSSVTKTGEPPTGSGEAAPTG